MRVTAGEGLNAALMVLGFLLWAGSAPDLEAADIPKAKAPPGNDLFSDGRVRSFRINVEEPALAALQKDNRAYVKATFTDGALTLRDVGVHLKGMGSFRPLHEKPSFVVKFDRFAPGQVYTGLSKIMLNNASQDSTYLAESIATQMFRDAGVPASRVAHAFVEFNGRPLGLYVLVEAMNKDFLKQHFRSNKGNLYEAYLADIDSDMDQDGGTNSEQADRKQLLEVVRIKDPNERWLRLQEVFEVDRYLSHLVLELFTSHTDGYAMNRNNYRLYHDPSTGRFTMIAHGIDWAFANTGVSIQPPRSSLLTKAVLQTPAGWLGFKERRSQLFTNLLRVDVLTNRVRATAAHLIAAARNPGEAQEFKNGADEMCNRIVARANNIAGQLAAPEPLPLAFDTNGVAHPVGWQSKKVQGELIFDRPKVDGKTTFHLLVVGPGDVIGSWRTKVLLEEGRYRFQALARVAHVAPLTNKVEQGNGVGIRISGEKRTNQLTGDLSWTPLEHEFEVVPGAEEKELVCELRGHEGEVWFDSSSLRLVRRR